MKDLTIVMPFLNEGKEPQRTIDSIYNTAHSKRFEIIAIDDCSKEISEIEPRNSIRVVRMDKRSGVGPCRQMGVSLAKTPYVLVIDAHMRFPNRWMDEILSFSESNPKSISCTTCLALGQGRMDLARARSKYYGATLKLIDDTSTSERPAREILEAKWWPKQKNGNYEIPCVLGANYFFKKEWFDYLMGWSGLRMWGTSEPFLSLKSYMAGGNSKIITDIEIGHKFRDKAPYSTGIDHLVFNKLFIMETIFPEILKIEIEKRIPKTLSYKIAKKSIYKIQKQIKKDREYYNSIFKKDILDYCKEYSIEMPHEIKDFR